MICVGWRCNKCWQMGKVHIRNRTKDEDILKWMEQEVGEQTGLAHTIASPRCDSGKVDILLKCHPEDEWIGHKDVLMEGPLRWDMFKEKDEGTPAG